MQGTRLEDQRSHVLPRQADKKELTHQKSQQGVTLVAQDEDFFTLVQKMQSRRLDEQRSEIIPKTTAPPTNIVNSSKNGSIV